MKQQNLKGALLGSLIMVSASGDAAIMDSDAREEKLNAVRSLVSNTVEPLDQDLLLVARSPFEFDLGKEVEAEEAKPVKVLTDDELLDALADYINPTGIFMFGGEFFLVFKEKKLTVGSELGIKYNGAEYSVAIANITGSTYTIRRGEAELQLKLK